MTEYGPNIPSRDDVVNAWKLVSDQGYGDPAEISGLVAEDSKSDDILRAENIYVTWYEIEKSLINTPEDALRFQFQTTMLYVDAGFNGLDYLDEVANDWLAQDAQAAEDQGFTTLAAEISKTITEINQRIEQQEP